ncbi:MAG: tyrosine--tRNA ligase [Candidatus Bathyarchaeia archaeon]
MNIEERVELVRRNTVEIITPTELRELLEKKNRPTAYWGFEPSGLMHLGTGLLCGYKILDLVEAGFDFTVLLADWHAWINNKFGGDLKAIRLCGEYFIQCFTALGLTSDRVRYIWVSDLVKDADYWEMVITVAKNSSVSRLTRCLPIMGRSLDAKELEVASLIYPCMQAADIFKLRIDCACAGIDQRKAHMLARDVSRKLGYEKPMSVHTPLLLGLQGSKGRIDARFDEDEALNLQISAKMSKSLPEGCVYIHDSPEEIRAKLKKAYCPPRQVEGNPVLEIAKYIIFARGHSLQIERAQRYGGYLRFTSYSELERAYVEGHLHPLDLKNSVAEALITILEPVREYFAKRSEILEAIKKLEITR